MGGKRKRNIIKPNTTHPVRPRSLPTQYDFVPRATTSASVPPVLPKKPHPSVKDYPPPRVLFPSSSFPPPSGPLPIPQSQPPQASPGEATSMPRPEERQSVEASPTPSLQGAPSPPLPRPSSPHSSQAQNSHTAGDSIDFDDVVDPVEPNLSDDLMIVLNSLLSQPGREEYTTVLSRNLEPGTTWFGYDKSKLTRKITKIFTNKFDGPYYSWTCVPRRRQERYFLEFAKKHTWNPVLTGLVQEHFESICLLRMKDMVSTARTTREQPNWIGDELWAQMTAVWDTEAAKAKSATASAARMSDRKGLGIHKHNSGQKSYIQIEQELTVELGRPVSFGEVFIKAHTKSDGSFIDFKAEKVAEAYMMKKEEKLANLQRDTSDGHLPILSIDEDNDLFIQSTFSNDRGHLYGIGSLKKKLQRRPNDPTFSSSFTQMQQKLEEAERKLEEQASLIAKDAEDRSRAEAARQAEMAELTLVKKYLLATDPRFLDFMATQTASSDPSQ